MSFIHNPTEFKIDSGFYLSNLYNNAFSNSLSFIIYSNAYGSKSILCSSSKILTTIISNFDLNNYNKWCKCCIKYETHSSANVRFIIIQRL